LKLQSIEAVDHKTLPKEGMALIKEMQSFAYGSVLDPFYLMVSTLKFKQQTQIDLKNQWMVCCNLWKCKALKI
jgi:hypothetical protein